MNEHLFRIKIGTKNTSRFWCTYKKIEGWVRFPWNRTKYNFGKSYIKVLLFVPETKSLNIMNVRYNSDVRRCMHNVQYLEGFAHGMWWGLIRLLLWGFRYCRICSIQVAFLSVLVIDYLALLCSICPWTPFFLHTRIFVYAGVGTCKRNPKATRNMILTEKECQTIEMSLCKPLHQVEVQFCCLGGGGMCKSTNKVNECFVKICLTPKTNLYLYKSKAIFNIVNCIMTIIGANKDLSIIKVKVMKCIYSVCDEKLC